MTQLWKINLPENAGFPIPGDRIGLVCCSDPLPFSAKDQLSALEDVLREMGLQPVLSPCILQELSGQAWDARKRARALTAFYKDPSVRAIFDLSGGDLANSILEELDYDEIRRHPKPFFGYSDVTVVLNTLFQKTESPIYYYQLRNLIRDKTGAQKDWFSRALHHRESPLWQLPVTFFQGSELRGRLMGGNLRCLLKLAGTPYFPDLQDAVLFLEARSGKTPQLAAYLTQLKQMGVFRQVQGILLGQFQELDQTEGPEAAGALLQKVVQNPALPMARTPSVGHSPDAKCLPLGNQILLKKEVFENEKNNR